MRIASNSWGLEEHSYYDDLCQQVDEYVWGHNDMFILFAAGNEGEKGYVRSASLSRSFDTISSPSFAKNALAVGAVYSDYLKIPDGKNYVTYFSSRGVRTPQGRPDSRASTAESSPILWPRVWPTPPSR